MNKKDFILLKAIFNPTLHEALLNEDLQMVEAVFKNDYKRDIEDNMVEDVQLSQEDISLLAKKHRKEIKESNFEWAF